MCLCPAAKYEHMICSSWPSRISFSIVNFVPGKDHGEYHLFVFVFSYLASSRWFHLGVHMVPVGARLLRNSGGMAISTTFSENGVEPEACHLCFTTLPLKTCVRLCMCVLLGGGVSHCMRVSMHGRKEKCITTPASQEGFELLHWHKMCVCVWGLPLPCFVWSEEKQEQNAHGYL